MGDGTLVPVVAGLVIGIGFIIALALPSFSIPSNDTFSSFTPDSFWSVEDGDNLGVITFGDEIVLPLTDGVMVQENYQSESVGAVEVIAVDFSVSLAESDVEVKKGQTVKIPIMIESDRETEKVLSLSIMPNSEVPDFSELALTLDKERVVLSEDDAAQADNGSGRLLRDAGFLTISASPTVKAGTYEYRLEASYEDVASGGGMGTGQLFRVTVVE